jgi:hypothetical protein
VDVLEHEVERHLPLTTRAVADVKQSKKRRLINETKGIIRKSGAK